MNNCLKGEVYAAWLWLTGYYAFETLSCASYVAKKGNAPDYVWQNEGGGERVGGVGSGGMTVQRAPDDYPPILSWYTRRFSVYTRRIQAAASPGQAVFPEFRGPGSSSLLHQGMTEPLPKGRLFMSGIFGHERQYRDLAACTGIIRKRPAAETAHLPPFSVQARGP